MSRVRPSAGPVARRDGRVARATQELGNMWTGLETSGVT